MWGNCHTVLKKTPPLFRSDLLNVKTSHNVETEQTVFYKVRLQSGQSGADIRPISVITIITQEEQLVNPLVSKRTKMHPPC